MVNIFREVRLVGFRGETPQAAPSPMPEEPAKPRSSVTAWANRRKIERERRQKREARDKAGDLVELKKVESKLDADRDSTLRFESNDELKKNVRLLVLSLEERATGHTPTKSEQGVRFIHNIEEYYQSNGPEEQARFRQWLQREIDRGGFNDVNKVTVEDHRGRLFLTLP